MPDHPFGSRCLQALPILAATLIAGALGLGMLLGPWLLSDPLALTTPEHAALSGGLFDNRGARLGYALLLLLLTGLAGMILYCAGGSGLAARWQPTSRLLLPLAMLSLALLPWALELVTAHGVALHALGLGGGLIAIGWAGRGPGRGPGQGRWRLGPRAVSAACGALLCVILWAIVLRPWSHTPVPPPWLEAWIAIEAHLAGIVLGAVDQLRSHLGSGLSPYGLVAPSLANLWLPGPDLPPLDAVVRMLRGANLLTVGLLSAAAALWCRQRPLRAAILMGGVALAWLHSTHNSIWYPNQGGWRWLGFALALLVFTGTARCRGRELICAALGGLVAGLAIGWNTETGIIFAAGIGMRAMLGARPVAACALTILGILAGIAGSITLITAINGTLIADFAHVLRLLLRFGNGYGALPLKLDGVGLAVILAATHGVLHAARRRAQGPLAPRVASRAGLSVMLLLWAGYWINRPARWNLWMLAVLLVLIGLERGPALLRHVVGALRACRWPAPGAAFVAIPVLLAGALALQSLEDEHYRIARSLRRPVDRSAYLPLSGIPLPPEITRALEQRAAEVLRLQADHGGARIEILSRFAVSTPRLTGIGNRWGRGDPFYETMTHADFRTLIAALQQRAPDILLIDDGAAPLPLTDGFRGFSERLIAALGDDYVPVAPLPGWRRWEKRPSRK